MGPLPAWRIQGSHNTTALSHEVVYSETADRFRESSAAGDGGTGSGDVDESSRGGPAGAAATSRSVDVGNGDSAGRRFSGSGQGPSMGNTQGAQPSPRGPNRGDTKSQLAMEGFEYGGTSGGMRRRFEELARIDVRDFPNATHDLLRTVLECAIKDYFRAKGEPCTGTLGQCIDKLAKEFQSESKMTSHINAIKRRGRMPADQYAGTADSLNTTNHEPDQGSRAGKCTRRGTGSNRSSSRSSAPNESRNPRRAKSRSAGVARDVTR